MVRITSPTKGEQIRVHSSLTVTGTSIANSTSVNCEVSVFVNGIKPYQKAVPTGHGGALDLAKNPIRVSSKETLKTTVFAANSNLTIAEASVNGTVTDSINTTTTNFNEDKDYNFNTVIEFNEKINYPIGYHSLIQCLLEQL